MLFLSTNFSIPRPELPNTNSTTNHLEESYSNNNIICTELWLNSLLPVILIESKFKTSDLNTKTKSKSNEARSPIQSLSKPKPHLVLDWKHLCLRAGRCLALDLVLFTDQPTHSSQKKIETNSKSHIQASLRSSPPQPKQCRNLVIPNR